MHITIKSRSPDFNMHISLHILWYSDQIYNLIKKLSNKKLTMTIDKTKNSNVNLITIIFIAFHVVVN